MYVIEVIPLSKNANLGSLSYYASTEYSIGTLIDVPLRNKLIRGLVVDSKPVSAAKTAVRAATFTLKKLPDQPDATTLPSTLIEVAKDLSKTYPATVGTTLFALLPPEVREGILKLEANVPNHDSIEAPAISVLQGLEEERYRLYRSRIREAFAHRGSVLFVVPTAAHIEKAIEHLSHGIENRIVCFSPQNTKKKQTDAMRDFHDLSKAKLIITTPGYLFIDRHDITLMIMESARSPHLKMRTKPYFDYREVLKSVARKSGRQLIFGDLLPRPEEEYLRREDIYQTENEHPRRIAFESQVDIISEADKPDPDTAFKLFSDELLTAIAETSKARKRSFLYAARRGIAPVVVCVDCGHIFRCPDSGAPYSLLRTTKNGEEKRWFLCATSGSRVPANDTCPDCGSWRLKERGVGIQHVHDELRKQLPKVPVFLFDHTTATTHRRAKQIIGEFYNTKGAVLLATSKVLPYLDEPVALSAITSLDAARSIPTWRADEEFFALLLELRERTSERLIVQTRGATDDTISYIKQGLVDQFYTDELALRQALAYPPFSTFVHLTIQGSQEALMPLEEQLNKLLNSWKPTFYPGPQSTPQKMTRYGLIRITKGSWPDSKLINTLTTLPPQVRIEINPARIV